MNQKNIISKLTLEEKIAMIHAAGLFRSGAVKRLNIPSRGILTLPVNLAKC